ncbi:MAG: hypothetical protein CMM87_03100 [Rickettsiales bacterium]|nr:hypothetical protein [Rickettsiales bacterium]|tara:strand:+ start:13613 stop:14554 length:942 start_codon:yes stop_codon:yes gene_type:complete
MYRKIIVAGCNDFTLEMADYLHRKNRLAGLVCTGKEISSKSGESQKIHRYVNLEQWAIERNLPHLVYNNQADLLAAQKKFSSSTLLLAGYHFIIPKKIIDQFSSGIYAMHASLLPQLRGWSPLNWAIILGFRNTGVSLFKVDEGMDSGPIFMQKKISIGSDTYISDLITSSFDKYKEILDVFIDQLDKNSIRCKKQDLRKSSFCLRRSESDSKIDWSRSVDDVLRVIRASSEPYFGAFSFLKGEKIRILRAHRDSDIVYGHPGQIYKTSKDSFYGVCCKDGGILLEKLSSDYLQIPEVMTLIKKSKYFVICND